MRVLVTGGTRVGNNGGAETDRGKQWSLHATHVHPVWRIGISANYNDGEGDADRLMGNVYLGKHEETGRVAAVKVLTASLAREPGFIERFNREIDAMRSTERINPRLKIHSPISGVLDSHKVELGQAVAANERLATVVSLDEVLVKAFVAPEDGVFVKTGDTVIINPGNLQSGQPVIVAAE